MANIKITVEGPLMDGHKITFKAPCNCDAVEKLDVRYIKDNEQKSKLFTMKDAHGNDLTGLGNLFYKDAYVDVVLDPNSGSAYLQNAGTNGYLEGKTTPVDNLESDRADLPLSARQGKILNGSLSTVSQVANSAKSKTDKINFGESATYFRVGYTWDNATQGNRWCIDFGRDSGDFLRFHINETTQECFMTHFYNNSWHDMWDFNKTRKG